MDTEKNDTEEEDELFYFESDHLALKGNADYSELLKVMFVLEAQRKRAIEDYNKVVSLQKEFEANPFDLVEKVQRNESLGVPDLQVIAEVPKINWDKFDVKIPENLLGMVNSSGNRGGGMTSDDLTYKKSSDTRSKPWTIEEQKCLEELLITYPPEDIELRRYKKIAAALGTRTVKQVCSRIQKYFLKLKKAGLPIPGRIPRLVFKKHKHQQSNYHFKPSTFFPELNIPVTMNECEDVPGASQSSYHPNDDTHAGNSSNYLLNTGYQEDKHTEHINDETEIQLKILQLIKGEKQREAEEDACLYQHIGYKCDYCEEDPISGSRWHCTTCQTVSVDFCTDCMLSQMYSTRKHPFSHKFSIIQDDENNISIEYEKSDFNNVLDDENNSELSSEIDSDELEEYIKSEPVEVKINGNLEELELCGNEKIKEESFSDSY